ncbi:MAG: stage II sporulation protein M [Emticicia sp.]|nr:stage II sporulation protein M [Emticicia sp.]
MREGTFIDRNVKRWEDIESDVKTDPDEISSDFIDLMNDLSYAQTHYPHSKINEYVNSLSSRVYKKIFLHQKQGKNPIYYFWVRDFPAILGHNSKILWVATISFLIFCVLGYICSTIDTNFIEAILGADYVKMTEENIKKGEPFGVYSSTSPLDMFLRIFSNNLWVGLILFVSGIGLGIGTFYFTFSNGVMVGAFLSLFIANNF